MSSKAASDATPRPTKSCNPNKKVEAKRIIEERGWKFIGPEFDIKSGKWKYRYEDQFGEPDAHSLARLKDLSCTARVPYIGEKLCRLIMLEVLPSIPRKEWIYNQRHDWLPEPITGNAMELDIYCKGAAIACEHNGRHHLLPYERKKDKVKEDICAHRGIKLLKIEQPTKLDLVKYCDLFEAEFSRHKILYDQAKMAEIRKLDGGATKVNEFIRACYWEFTQQVIDYIRAQGGILLKVDGTDYRDGMAITKKSKLQIDTCCSHGGNITPEALQMLGDESWCKSCKLQENRAKNFSQFIDGLRNKSSYYASINISLEKVIRDSKGAISICCEECNTWTSKRTREFLETVEKDWCTTCNGRNNNSELSRSIKYKAQCEELGWEFKELCEEQIVARCKACGSSLQLTTRQLSDFETVGEICCPTARTGGADVVGNKYTIDDVRRLLLAIHPNGKLISDRLTEDQQFKGHCGCTGHSSFNFKFQALRKAVARNVVSELISKRLLNSGTPDDKSVSIVNLVTKTEGLVWDPSVNYAESAREFLLANSISSHMENELRNGEKTTLVSAADYKFLQMKNYGCVRCSPNAKRKGRSQEDFLERLREIDSRYADNRRKGTREVAFRIDPSDPNTFHISCGAADHEPFSRSRSNWNRIEERYCPKCKLQEP